MRYTSRAEPTSIFLDDGGFITYAAHGMPAYGDIFQNEHSPVIRGGADVGVCYT